MLVDRALGASQLARDMVMSGHTKFFAIERVGQTIITDAIRRAAGRCGNDVIVDSGEPKDVAAALEHGVTAFICGSRALAVQTREQLERLGAEIPARISLGGVGHGWGEYPCSGYFVHVAQEGDAVVQLLRDKNAHRPVTLWLTGQFIDGGTIASHSGDKAMHHLSLSARMNTVSA